MLRAIFTGKTALWFSLPRMANTKRCKSKKWKLKAALFYPVTGRNTKSDTNTGDRFPKPSDTIWEPSDTIWEPSDTNTGDRTDTCVGDNKSNKANNKSKIQKQNTKAKGFFYLITLEKR
jgi:hypothetical protein